MKISKAWKAVAAAAGGVTTALTAAVADDVIGMDEVGQLGTAALGLVLTVYAVWKVPNRAE